MATLIPALIPLGLELIDFIASIVHPKVVAASATGTTGTGPVLLADVFAATMGDLAKAHAAGMITGTLPDDATVKVIIQSVYTALKLSGVLSAASPALQAGGAQPIALKSGQSILISAV
jgi:hypothetical protein